MNDNFWLSEYENNTTIYQKYVELYIKTFVVCLGVHGVLLKFALDKNSTSELKLVLGIFALLCCLLLFICIYFAQSMSKKLKRKRELALEHLKVETEDTLVALNWGSIVFSIANIILIIGWMFLLMKA